MTMDEDQKRAIATGCGCRCSWCGNNETRGFSHCGRMTTGCFSNALSVADAREQKKNV